MVPLAFGTQTVGSIIRPASFCGVVGYKPSFGMLSRAGIKLLSESLDTVGAIARTVDDAALMVGALTGRGELIDLAKVDRPWVGLCRTHDWRETQPEVGAAMDAAARGLAAAGARVIQVELPQDFAALGDAYGRALRPRPRAGAPLPRGAAGRLRRVPRPPRAEHHRRGARGARVDREPGDEPRVDAAPRAVRHGAGRQGPERPSGRAAGDRPVRRRRAHARRGAMDPRADRRLRRGARIR
jgi:Asp-tRNA(Asn)/Glu-tRNA(Gln) amidotransferase A subunit family amidase